MKYEIFPDRIELDESVLEKIRQQKITHFSERKISISEKFQIYKHNIFRITDDDLVIGIAALLVALFFISIPVLKYALKLNPIYFYLWIIGVVFLSIQLFVILLRLLPIIKYSKKEIEREPKRRIELYKQREIKRIKDEINKVKRKNERENEKINLEAIALADRTNNLLDSILILSEKMQNDLKTVSKWLTTAKIEFTDNAADPYWMALQNAANNLNEYQKKAEELDSKLNSYFDNLKGRNHNFPESLLQIETIQEAGNLKEEYYKVKRLGDTKDGFFHYYGLIKINATLVNGFRTFEDAINNIGRKFENSLSKLEQTINNGFADSLESENLSYQELKQTNQQLSQSINEQNKILINTKKILDRSTKD